MRILGIDYGDSRTGIALSDPLGWTAQGLPTIESGGEADVVVKRIVEICSRYGVEKIVVGFPRNMDGSVGFRGEKTREFVEALKTAVDAEIVLQDERLSTAAAERTMHEIGLRPSRNKRTVDRISAVHILQGYLNSIKTT